MAANPGDFERKALELARAIIAQRAGELASLGLASPASEIGREWVDESAYRSEIRLYFHDERDLFDVIEFFIWEGGKAVASLPEIEEWLGDYVDNVMERKLAHLG